ncbi:MAG: amidophosphoribosyltransferase [Elusimicrobiota bacterium]|nr:amidophosphoribosyltransferase [Elusimicrobiota bacterium]
MSIRGNFKDQCGLFGIYSNKDAARLTYFGLYALQHRGQESAGIVVSNNKFLSHLGMGLVSEVFNKEILSRLYGDKAIGHVRYSTAGESTVKNAQPLVMTYFAGQVAIAHNGNIFNASTLRRQLELEGAIFQTSADSEIVLHLIAHSKQRRIEEKIIDAISHLRGAYCFLILTKDKLIAIRDPYGVRPLSIAKLNSSYVIASETCAFDLIGARFLRDVQPGEMVIIDDKGMSSVRFSKQQKTALCIFEFIYFSRPDSFVFSKSVYSVRKKLGEILAKEGEGVGRAAADIVMSVPDSANAQAVGYSYASGIPLETGLIRNHYIGRTFIQPKQSIRDFEAKIKYNPVGDIICGKRIVLIDDSIVRGTTGRKLIKMLKKSGAKKVHYRISSPPIRYPCYYGIDTPTRKELIAANYSLEYIRNYMCADSLRYISIDGLIKSTGMNKDQFCLACFTGEYPI